MAIPDGLLAQLNAVNCGAAGILGTGLNHCRFDRNRVEAVMLTTSGYEFTEELSLAYVQELQQSGIAIMLPRGILFENLTADDNVETYEGSNIKVKAGESPYEYQMTFNNGLYFYKALNSLESFGNYDMTYFDQKLSILFTASPTVAKGLTMGQFAKKPYQGATGAVSAKQMCWWQELYRSEFDRDAAWVTADHHDIRLANLEGVNDITLDFTVIPVDGATTLKFKAYSTPDNKLVDLGLLIGDLKLVKNVAGVLTPVTPSLIATNATTKEVTLTVAAVNEDEIYTLVSNNVTYSTNIILKGGRLYKTNTATVTVIA